MLRAKPVMAINMNNDIYGTLTPSILSTRFLDSRMPFLPVPYL